MNVNEESEELGFPDTNIGSSNQYIKPKTQERYTLKQTSSRFINFIPYKDLCSTLILQTKVDIPANKPFIEKEVDFVKVPILPIIRSGSRHNMFKIQINCLMYLNPDITLLELQSFINFWNRHMTDEPLSTKDMLDTVGKEYDRLKGGGTNIARVTKKFIHTNPLFGDRIMIANKANGRRKVCRSKKVVQEAITAVIEANSDINLKNIEERTEGSVKIGTIKKYWRGVLMEMLTDALMEQEFEMYGHEPSANNDDMLELGFVLDGNGKWQFNLTKKPTGASYCLVA